MKQEIYSIIEEMKKRSPQTPITTFDIHTYQSVQMARLLVLLAEEAETQNNKISSKRQRGRSPNDKGDVHAERA